LDMSLPYWMYLWISGVLAASGWIRSFSLRQLLIAMILLAVTLGLLIALSR
jgi:hypothetical protein